MIHDLGDLFGDAPLEIVILEPEPVPLGETYREAVDYLGMTDAQTLALCLMTHVTGADPTTSLPWAVLADDDQLHRLNVPPAVLDALTEALDNLNARHGWLTYVAGIAEVPAPPAWLVGFGFGVRAAAYCDSPRDLPPSTWHCLRPAGDLTSELRNIWKMVENLLLGTDVGRVLPDWTDTFCHGRPVSVHLPAPVLAACVEIFDAPNSLVTITR